ncbi:hypothetical protein B0H13DRAFT_1538839, partial [Mycena leptocephala]
RSPHPQCHHNEQIELLEDIYSWSSEDDHKSQVLWLYGRAGAGKSAIAQALCDKIEAEGRLGGSFFFKQGHLSRGNGNKLFVTIAYQLSLRKGNPALNNAILHAVQENPSLLHRSLSVQLQSLIIEPCLKAISRDTLVVIIDGLDECQDENVQLEILHSIANVTRCADNVPLRFFISSRPDSHIGDAFCGPGLF